MRCTVEKTLQHLVKWENIWHKSTKNLLTLKSKPRSTNVKNVTKNLVTKKAWNTTWKKCVGLNPRIKFVKFVTNHSIPNSNLEITKFLKITEFNKTLENLPNFVKGFLLYGVHCANLFLLLMQNFKNIALVPIWKMTKLLKLKIKNSENKVSLFNSLLLIYQSHPFLQLLKLDFGAVYNVTKP